MKMPFGKYKGTDIVDVPLDYLIWLEEHANLTPAFRAELNFEISRRETPGLGKVIKKPERNK